MVSLIAVRYGVLLCAGQNRLLDGDVNIRRK